MSTTAIGLASNPVRSPFSAELQSSGQLDPGRSWFDGNGVWHLRGQVSVGTITGGINGQVRITQNMNLDISTFSGNIQVKAVITADSGAVYDMFACVTIENMMLSGIFTIHGTGGLRGTHMMGIIGGVAGGVATLNGYQFTPRQ